MEEKEIRRLIWRILLDAKSPRDAEFEIDRMLNTAGIPHYSPKIVEWGGGIHGAHVKVRLSNESKELKLIEEYCRYVM